MEKKAVRKDEIYRVDIVEDKTHRKIRSYRISLWGAIAAGVTAFVLLITLIWSIIAFTPLRMSIPGYPDIESKNQAVQNAIRIDSLENAITRWELYAENLNRVLNGEKTITLDSLISGNTTKFLKQTSEEKMKEQEKALRKELSGDTKKR